MSLSCISIQRFYIKNYASALYWLKGKYPRFRRALLGIVLLILLAKANIPSLYNRRLQDIAVSMYKIKYKLLPQRLCNLFQLDSGSYHLRKREFVQPRFSSVTYGKHSLRYLGPKLWNDLTPRIRNLPPLKQFKSVIRNQDLTALAANVSDCRGCNLCQE